MKQKNDSIETDFKEYSKKKIHFYDEYIPQMLVDAISKKSGKRFNILDLGCGDGRFLRELQSRGYLNNANIVAVDLSPDRIRNLTKSVKNSRGIVSDACDVKELGDNSFDIIISSQVIEHVPDDNKLLKEIRRLLKKDGLLYVSSVVKKWYGLYIYSNNGHIRLDPTHVREYKSREEFENLLKNNSLNLQKSKTSQCSFPVIDMFIRLLIMVDVIQPDTYFFKNHRFLSKARIIKYPVIGYKSIEAIACK